MLTNLPLVLLAYPETLPNEPLEGFLQVMEQNGIPVTVERRETGPRAGLEWLLPTAAFLFFAKPYVEGFLKKAGEEHYIALKNALGKFWPLFFGPERRIHVTAIASGSAKLADDTYSRTFSLMARDDQGRTVKLLLRDGASREELDAAALAFLRFLPSLYAENAGRNMKVTGGVALLVYDAETGSLRSLDPFKRD